MKAFLRFLQQIIPLCLTSLFVFLTCNEEPTKSNPPIEKPRITITTANVTSKEITLKIALPDSDEPRRVKVFRDGRLILSTMMKNNDTLITDGGLDANCGYTYFAQRLRDSTVTERSDTLKTMTSWRHPSEYVWTIDTLRYPGSFQTLLERLYGVSSNDIYAVGFNSLSRGQMYHYDGKSWSPVKLTTAEGGSIQATFELEDIFGYGSNQIYAVGTRLFTNLFPPPYDFDSSFIIHYDGLNWREIKMKRSHRLFAVWGSSPNDIWAGGEKGTLYHFQGTQWELVSFDTTINIKSLYGFSATDIYATAARYSTHFPDTSEYFLYHYNGSKWSLVDSFRRYLGSQKLEKFGLIRVWGLSPDVLYSIGGGVFKYNGNTWDRVAFNNLNFRGIHGRWSNHIFAVANLNAIYYYDGKMWTDFWKIIPPGDLWYYDVWCTEDEVFILGGDGARSYIYHGK